jgi:hypothetical protein
VIQDNLTAKQNDYAVFLPAISGFYATYIGKQRDPVNGPYKANGIKQKSA